MMGTHDVGRLDRSLVGSVGARGSERLEKKARAHRSRLTWGRAGFDPVGGGGGSRPTRDRLGWLGRLAGPGDGPIGPSTRVMNIVYMYIYIKEKYRTQNSSCCGN
jgi:hypothetical protein